VLKIRKRNLPEGWYPKSSESVEKLVQSWVPADKSGKTVAGIVPHAGWMFCGNIIAEVLSTLPSFLDCIVVLGGHNPPGGKFIAYIDDDWDLPSGTIRRGAELAETVTDRMPETMAPVPERAVDNTVEVVMPLVAALRPDARWAAWRIPADERAIDFGRILYDSAEHLGLRIAVIGSTDLTHYGPDYHFTPRESLSNPGRWMEARDRAFLNSIAAFRGPEALELANAGNAACSAGGAVAAMEFARISGSGPGRILTYSTSRELHPSSSAVGYGSVIWEAS
jgi:AmmeMemoRadiSam system protein B